MVGLPTTVIKEHIDLYGVTRGLPIWARKAYLRKFKSIEGVNYFDKSWDVLIVLDACRLDLWHEVSEEYEFMKNTRAITSVGSSTPEWISDTFSSVAKDTLDETVFVCANPFSEQLLDPDDFLTLDEVWRYAWDEQAGTVRPRPVTDRAIRAGRNIGYDRMVVHYLQPHFPFLTSEDSPGLVLDEFEGERDFKSLDDWKLVALGEKELSTVWEDYRENLRCVLDDVGLLLSNLDAETVVITSDHGNAVGEYGLYGHPGSVPIQALREVPWCETEAVDKGTHSPAEYNIDTMINTMEERLTQLGYI